MYSVNLFDNEPTQKFSKTKVIKFIGNTPTKYPPTEQLNPLKRAMIRHNFVPTPDKASKFPPNQNSTLTKAVARPLPNQAEKPASDPFNSTFSTEENFSLTTKNFNKPAAVSFTPTKSMKKKKKPMSQMNPPAIFSLDDTQDSIDMLMNSSDVDDLTSSNSTTPILPHPLDSYPIYPPHSHNESKYNLQQKSNIKSTYSAQSALSTFGAEPSQPSQFSQPLPASQFSKPSQPLQLLQPQPSHQQPLSKYSRKVEDDVEALKFSSRPSTSTTRKRKTLRKSCAAQLFDAFEDGFDMNDNQNVLDQQQPVEPEQIQPHSPTVSFNDLINNTNNENTLDIMNAIFNPHDIPHSLLEKNSNTWAMLNCKELDFGDFDNLTLPRAQGNNNPSTVFQHIIASKPPQQPLITRQFEQFSNALPICKEPPQPQQKRELTKVEQLKKDKIRQKIANYVPDLEALKPINDNNNEDNNQNQMTHNQHSTFKPHTISKSRFNVPEPVPQVDSNPRRRKSMFMRADQLGNTNDSDHGQHDLTCTTTDFDSFSTNKVLQQPPAITGKPNDTTSALKTIQALSNGSRPQVNLFQPQKSQLPGPTSSQIRPLNSNQSSQVEKYFNAEVIQQTSCPPQPQQSHVHLSSQTHHQHQFQPSLCRVSSIKNPSQEAKHKATKPILQSSQNTSPTLPFTQALQSQINSFSPIETTLNLYKFAQGQTVSEFNPQSLSTFIPITTYIPPTLDIFSLLFEPNESLIQYIEVEKLDYVTSQYFTPASSISVSTQSSSPRTTCPQIWQLLFTSSIYALVCLSFAELEQHAHLRMLTNSITELLSFLKQDTLSLIRKQQQTTSLTIHRDRFEHLIATTNEHPITFPINPFLTIPLITHQHFSLVNVIVAFFAFLWEEQYRSIIQGGNCIAFGYHTTTSSTYQPTMAQMLLKTQFINILTIFKMFSSTVLQVFQSYTDMDEGNTMIPMPSIPWHTQPVYELNKTFLKLLETTFESSHYFFPSDVNFAEPASPHLIALGAASCSTVFSASNNTENSPVYSNSSLIIFLHQTIEQINSLYPKSYALQMKSSLVQPKIESPTHFVVNKTQIQHSLSQKPEIVQPKNPPQNSSFAPDVPTTDKPVPFKKFSLECLSCSSDDQHSISSCDTNSLLNLTFASPGRSVQYDLHHNASRSSINSVQSAALLSRTNQSKPTSSSSKNTTITNCNSALISASQKRKSLHQDGNVLGDYHDDHKQVIKKSTKPKSSLDNFNENRLVQLPTPQIKSSHPTINSQSLLSTPSKETIHHSMQSKLKAQTNFPQTPIRKHRIQRGQLTPLHTQKITLSQHLPAISSATSTSRNRSIISASSSTNVKTMAVASTSNTRKIEPTTSTMVKPVLTKKLSHSTTSTTTVKTVTKPATSTRTPPSTSSGILLRTGNNYRPYSSSTAKSTIPAVSVLKKPLTVKTTSSKPNVSKPTLGKIPSLSCLPKQVTIKLDVSSKPAANILTQKTSQASISSGQIAARKALKISEYHPPTSYIPKEATIKLDASTKPAANILTQKTSQAGRKVLKISDIRKLQ